LASSTFPSTTSSLSSSPSFSPSSPYSSSSSPFSVGRGLIENGIYFCPDRDTLLFTGLEAIFQTLHPAASRGAVAVTQKRYRTRLTII
jgi:hypothetical protein